MFGSDVKARNVELCMRRAVIAGLVEGSTPLGYGIIKGQKIPNHDTIFEFYLLPEHRHRISERLSVP